MSPVDGLFVLGALIAIPAFLVLCLIGWGIERMFSRHR